ncbi:MAG TPA: hypothetical protein VGN61_04770 [Verrucomicrobiae bacterium]
MRVNLFGKWAWVLGCVAASLPVVAAAVTEVTPGDSNPYGVISDRDVFHLNPEPKPDLNPPVKPPDLPKVFLSGFQKVGDRIKVYLTVPAKDPKDTVYLSLQQGEKGNDVEIVKVNEDKGAVDIVNGGTPETLTLASNGVASTGGGGGGPPSPGGIRNRMMPGMPRANMQAAAASSAPTTMGGSAIVIGGNSDASSSGSAYGGGSSSYSGGVTVSGGTSSFGGGGGVGAAPGNNTSAQIANALFSGTSGQGYRPPTQDVIPAPPAQQAASLILNDAAGGPPSPVGPDGGPPVPRAPVER